MYSYEDIKAFISDFKRNPVKVGIVTLVLLLFGGGFGYMYNYLGEKGKQHASVLKDRQTPVAHSKQEYKPVEPSSSLNPKHQKKKDKSPRSHSDNKTVTLETTGRESPAVNVEPGGQSIINYGTTGNIENNE